MTNSYRNNNTQPKNNQNFGSLCKTGKLDTFAAKEGWEKYIAPVYEKDCSVWTKDLVDFVATWCNLMEKEMAKGVDRYKAAMNTMAKADETGATDSGYLFDSACAIIDRWWQHGEGFKKMMVDKGQSIYNPITIKAKE